MNQRLHVMTLSELILTLRNIRQPLTDKRDRQEKCFK